MAPRGGGSLALSGGRSPLRWDRPFPAGAEVELGGADETLSMHFSMKAIRLSMRFIMFRAQLGRNRGQK